MSPSARAFPHSILAADIGSVWTRVLLVERVEGRHRFVTQAEAPTSGRPPHGGWGEGLRAAIRHLEARTERPLLDPEGNLITPEDEAGRGVDQWVATCSAAEPLRVAVIGLTERLSTASARRAALSTYSQITDSFSLDAAPSGVRAWTTHIVERLLARWPDVVLLAGGTEDAAPPILLELAAALRLAMAAPPHPTAPTVIFAGNREMGAAIQARLGPGALHLVPPLRPTLATERLAPTSRLLEEQFRQRLQPISGAEPLISRGHHGPLPASEAIGRVARFLALRDGKRVLIADVGGGSTVLALATPDGEYQTFVRAGLGLSHGAEALLAEVGAERIVGWVPGDAAPQPLIESWLTQSLFPTQPPVSPESLYLLQGATRAALHHAARDLWGDEAGWPAVDLIVVGGGALRAAPRPAQALAMVLEALQPSGIVHLLRDRAGLIGAAGALADVAPQAAADLLATQGFESLGIAIVPIGQARPGETVLRFRLQQGEGTQDGIVACGQIYRLPTPDPAEIELFPLRGFDVGGGPNGRVTLRTEGDPVGFVIDARGRPLVVPEALAEQRALVADWMRYVGA